MLWFYLPENLVVWAQKSRDPFIHTGNIIWLIPNNADEALKFCSPADSFRSRSKVEKSWHQKKRESLWSAGHQYSLWAPPLTFRFVAKPICLDLSRVLPRVAFGPPALGFPPNLSQSPNPPDPKLTSQSSHTDKNYHHHYHHHHRSLSASLYFHKGIVHWLNCTEVARCCHKLITLRHMEGNWLKWGEYLSDNQCDHQILLILISECLQK